VIARRRFAAFRAGRFLGHAARSPALRDATRRDTWGRTRVAHDAADTETWDVLGDSRQAQAPLETPLE